MNFQCTAPSTPLKVYLINPLLACTQLVSVKILSGSIFGINQKIHLIFLVYENEISDAEAMKIELENCAFNCLSKIELTTNFPCYTDAEVFCFMTSWANPNKVDFEERNNGEEEDNNSSTLNFLIALASNLNGPLLETETELEIFHPQQIKDTKSTKDHIHKPIFMTDGLITMNIINICSKNIPADAFFCPTPLVELAKIILSDYLKAQCSDINQTSVWAANDDAFHIEVLKPVIAHDTPNPEQPQCDRGVIGKELMDELNMDHTQFGASWMKNEFIERVKSFAIKNPYGPICRASLFASALKTVWMARTNKNNEKEIFSNLGVISDGSYETVKGTPLVLPIILNGDSWTVNKSFEDNYHVQLEIKKINAIAKDNSEMLKSCYRSFLQDNLVPSTDTTKSSEISGLSPYSISEDSRD